MTTVIVPSLPGSDVLNKSVKESIKHTQTSKVRLLLIEKQQSFAKNVNEGLRQLDRDEDVLVLNNDVILLPGWQGWLEQTSPLGLKALTPRPDCGWGFFIPAPVRRVVGFLDDNLENSYEDYDYFIRCALHGFPRIMANQILAVHMGGRTLNQIWGDVYEQRPVRLETCRKNRAYMQEKWPGVDVDAVPTLRWTLDSLKIMKRWRETHEGKA